MNLQITEMIVDSLKLMCVCVLGGAGGGGGRCPFLFLLAVGGAFVHRPTMIYTHFVKYQSFSYSETPSIQPPKGQETLVVFVNKVAGLKGWWRKKMSAWANLKWSNNEVTVF